MFAKDKNGRRHPLRNVVFCHFVRFITSLFFCISDNRLFTIRSYGNDLHRHTQFFLQERKVSIALLRELVLAPHLRHIRLPTR